MFIAHIVSDQYLRSFSMLKKLLADKGRLKPHVYFQNSNADFQSILWMIVVRQSKIFIRTECDFLKSVISKIWLVDKSWVKSYIIMFPFR